MAKKNEDLWPDDIATIAAKAPVAILREQAANLSRRTKNLVEGEVFTETKGERLNHRFLLVAPALDNYKYELFTISHGTVFYPLELFTYQTIESGVQAVGKEKIESEEQFITTLKKLFSSTQTKNIIRSLLAQIQS